MSRGWLDKSPTFSVSTQKRAGVAGAKDAAGRNAVMCLLGLGPSSWFHWKENRLSFALRGNCMEEMKGPSQVHYSSNQESCHKKAGAQGGDLGF